METIGYIPRNASECEQEAGLMNVIEAPTKDGFIEYLYGTFGAAGKEPYVLSHKANKALKTEKYNLELEAFLEQLQRRSSTLLIKNAETMRSLCARSPEFNCAHAGFPEQIAFVGQTQTHSFFIRCNPQPKDEDCEFWVFSYLRDALIAAGLQDSDKGRI